MKSLILLIIFACSNPANAANLDVFGVVLGEKPSFEKCIGGDYFQTPPDGKELCMSEGRTGEKLKSFYFSMSSCPKFTPCNFYATVNDDEKVVGFWIPTSGNGAKQLAQQTLIKKFGKPTETFVETVQNGFGAKFASHTYTWKKPGYIVRYFELWGSLSEGKISIETPESEKLKKLSELKPASF